MVVMVDEGPYHLGVFDIATSTWQQGAFDAEGGSETSLAVGAGHIAIAESHDASMCSIGLWEVHNGTFIRKQTQSIPSKASAYPRSMAFLVSALEHQCYE